MTAAVTLVCGFGRCGSSLTLQMLAAGGMRVAGTAPSYEPDQVRAHACHGNILSAHWLDTQRGGAIKLLDPHRFVLPPGDYRAIWLNRNPRQQARSQSKFGAILLGIPQSRQITRAFARSFLTDKPKALHVLRAACGAEVIELDFEGLIGAGVAVPKLAAFCGGLDVDRLRSVVLPRGPESQPGLDIELSLIEAHGRPRHIRDAGHATPGIEHR